MFVDHLDKHIGTDGLEKVPARNGYGEGLHAAGEKDPRVVALCADLTGSTRMDAFRDAFPERFIEVGIAEQNMASVASGMAAMGKIPFISSYAMFSPGRNWEQIRTTIAYNGVNVKIAGSHAGVSVGPDGATHQALEDIAITRVIPRMVVIAPADATEAKKATLAAAEYEAPIYIRLAREATPVVTTEASPFAIGRAEMLCEAQGKPQVGIVATGTILPQALAAAKVLNEAGVGASVLHMATIKPLDTKALESFAKEHKQLVTVEEHQIIGGLGSAVAEHLSGVRPVQIERIGINDRFGESGDPEELLAHFGLDAKSIAARVNTALKS